MNRYLSEFFWMPTEMVRWLRLIVPELRLWVVLWEVGQDSRAVDSGELLAEMFEGRVEDSIQLFLGDLELSHGPVWHRAEGGRLLDLHRSYAVQLIPPVMIGRTLLQGRLAMLQPDQYENPECAAKLIILFRRLRKSMKRHSDSTRVITQRLSAGGKKHWKSMLVGKDVPGEGVVQLKQFVQGSVVFEVEAA